jgi:hypothetical protein
VSDTVDAHLSCGERHPVVTILRPARTPKGIEVRTVVKHVTKRLRRHWPNTRIVWRGDSHYGRVEAMDWAEDNATDYIFGLAGNAPLDVLVAEAADNLRFHHAMSSKAKLRTFASFTYRAHSWRRPRKVVARLECSLQPIAGETGMRQEVDIRYVVTSLEGSAQHLYENVYCQRDGESDQAAQDAVGVGSHVVSQRDRQSSPARSSHRRVLANAWRPRRHPSHQRACLRRVRDNPRAPYQDWRARDRAHCPHPRPTANELSRGDIVPHRCTRPHAVRPMSCGAVGPDEPPFKADQPQRVAQRVASHRSSWSDR